MNVSSMYDLWLQKAVDDPDLIDELLKIEGKEDEIYDRFYRELEFGTAGLRGVIGAGTNRMNVYTVRKATQGMADYVNAHFRNGSVAIAHDSRIKSDLFTVEAARVLAANGIKVYLYSELMPTPMLSFAVRHLHCSAGIVITASHNPAKYNGYKAYGSDGCQLSVENSAKVLDYVNKTEMFGGPKLTDFDGAVANGTICYIGQETIDAFLNTVQKCSVRPVKADLKVVYTPLNGTGKKPVLAILDRIGIKNVSVVPEQENPDGNFPTVPFPNPEIREAFNCAFKLAEKVHPDLLLATDPDCDRVGIAVHQGNEYHLMTGNEVGVLLLNYILEGRKENGTLPEHPVAVKTIVTTELAAVIARAHNCEIRNVFTGFKYIGEQIALLEAAGEENRFIFGYEESYGYMAGGYVRDKDAVVASMLICEMAAYYKEQGKTLLDVMNSLYDQYGMYLSVQKSYVFEGAAGMDKMARIMQSLRALPPAKLGGADVTAVLDYEASEETDLVKGEKRAIPMEKSNVLSYRLDDGAGVIVRPSGTEPKIKAYITAVASDRKEAELTAASIISDVDMFLA